MNELIQMYCYYEDMMTQNGLEDEQRVMYRKLRDYIGSLIEGEYEDE
jgi:hypothetical protein